MLQKKRTLIVKSGHLLLEVRSRLFLSWERMIKGTIPKNMVVKVMASRIPTCIKRKKSQSHHNQVTVHFNLHHCQVKERLLRSTSDNRHGHVQGVHVWGCRDVVHQVHYGNLRKVQVEIFNRCSTTPMFNWQFSAMRGRCQHWRNFSFLIITCIDIQSYMA